MANNSETWVTIPDQKGLFEFPPKQSLFTISRKTSGMSNRLSTLNNNARKPYNLGG